MSSIINIQDLYFSFGEKDFQIRIPGLHLTQGEKVALTGPSGCGKTTLAYLIAGIYLPLSGRITVNNTVISALPDKIRRNFRSLNIGFIFQEFELLSYLRVWENIYLPFLVNLSLNLTAEIKDYARELAQSVGIANRLNHYPEQLSHGERQRVAVCRALVARPKVILADEPTGNLDPKTSRSILQLIHKKIEESGMSLLMITHDHSLLSQFDRALSMPSIK